MNTVIPFRAQPPLDAYELALQFLERVLPSEGVYFAGVKAKRGAWKDTHHSTIENLCTHLFEADRNGGDAYFATAAFISNADGRKAENVRALRALRLEIDYGREGHSSTDIYAIWDEALAAFESFRDAVGLPEPMINLSGGGLHVFWPLKDAISASEWKRYSEGLKAACHRYRLKAGHECTADAARVLRLPGTTNRKLPGKPRPVTLNPRFLDIEPYDLAQFEVLLGFAPQRKTAKALSLLPPKPAYLDDFKIDPRAFPEHYELVDVDALAAECGVVAEFQRTGDICEPTWMRHALLFHYIENGEALFHEYSLRNYPKYDQRQAQEKYDRAGAKRLTGPPLCSGFKDDTDQRTREICLACPHLGVIVTPLQGVPEPEDSGNPGAGGSAEAATTGTKRKPLQWELTQGGAIKPRSYANAELAINALGITGSYNEFRDRKYIAGDLPENYGPELSDPIGRVVRHMINARFNFDPGKDNVHEALEYLCDATRFNPVLDYLDSLEWDGKLRLDRWLIDYLGAEDTALNRAFGRKTLVAAVRRARQPGCKFDYMLVLEGPQRAGKSSAVQILAVARENFSDMPIKWDDPQKQMEAVGGIWLYELSELVGLRKADVENVKNFLSRQVDRVRPSYGRHPVDRPRRCVFIGTVNPDKGSKVALWSNDPSGATRFWPVVTGVIDLEALKRDRDQLWAEASAVEAKGEALPIDPSLYKDATLQQELRQAPEPWMDVLDGVAGTVFPSADGDMERISTREVFMHLNMHAGQMTSATSARLARAMNRLDWSGPKVLHLPEKGRFRGYERAAPVKEGKAQGPERPKGPAPAK